MTRVFVLTNHKGGVGKSTSATTIALGSAGDLRRAGASNSRVLLIDTDSQGHATLVTTGRNDFGAEDSLYAVLAADRANAAQTMADCIVASSWDADLHVLPASIFPCQLQPKVIYVIPIKSNSALIFWRCVPTA